VYKLICKQFLDTFLKLSILIFLLIHLHLWKKYFIIFVLKLFIKNHYQVNLY